MITLYLLRDPITFEVRYIGQTKDITRRYAEHLYYAASEKTYKANWILSLKKKGYKPVMETVSIVPDEVANETEIDYIAIARNLGWLITNCGIGGDRGAVTEEAKKRYSLLYSGKPRSEETKKKISAAKIGHTHSEETKQKIREARARQGPIIRPRVTHCWRGHEFTPENTYTRPNTNYQACRECLRTRHKKYRNRKKGANL